MQTFFWIEDRKDKAGYIFWKTFLGQMFPEIIVESKKNSSELVKSVITLKDSENRYVVALDNSFDNPQVVMEQKLLSECVKTKSNIFILDIICFEYVLLEFKDLLDWIYAHDDDLLAKRKNVVSVREKFIEAMRDAGSNYKDICEIIKYNEKIDDYNVERLSAKILFDLTRNTGFEVSKGKIGECWVKSCCDWEQRMPDDICGLDGDRPKLRAKMLSIYKGTSLLEKFKIIGLEAVS